MNYLAHLNLAEITSESLIGNLLGDFCTDSIRSLILKYQEDISYGVWMHRKIDRFTDSHPTVRRSKNRIDRRFGLFKGIMVDVYYDHYLAKRWRDYSNTVLEDFTQQVYKLLCENKKILPEKLLYIFPSRKSEDWLASYREIEPIDSALNRIVRKIKVKCSDEGAEC